MQQLTKISALTISFFLAVLVLTVTEGRAQNFNALKTDEHNDEANQMKDQSIINEQSIDPLSDENIKNVVSQAVTLRRRELTPDEASRYTLGPDDVIEVSVMRHPEVSGRYPINKEGKIQYEFLGDVLVSGQTKDQVVKLLADKLKEYIINPDVRIKIAEYNSKIVYVVGEVGRPGKIFMRGDTITVREALMDAGLPLLTGILKRSRVITPAVDGNMKKRNVNIYALLYEGDLRQNLIMQAGDVLYVPPTFLTKTMRAIQPVTEPLGAANSTGRAVVAPYP